jgi:glycosyltransferase involved in cell wall biosynthesis
VTSRSSHRIHACACVTSSTSATNSPGYEGDDPAYRTPARVFPRGEVRYDQYSALTDRRIADHLSKVDSDVVIGTRPGLNVHLARETRRGPLRVGQEHLTLDTHSESLRTELRGAYPRLDALTTTTEADAGAYRKKMRLPGVHVEAVPNPVPAPGIEPADGSGKWVVAAGRLAPVKRYDLLIKAFDRVRQQRPDWRLRIYGGGKQKDKLRRLIDELGLYNHVLLMGPAHPIEPEWAKGSIAAVTSSLESFGMTIVEAMRCGLPVVSTDCPHGPGEIIDNGVDGRLVPVGNVEAIADGLLELINNDELRQRMAPPRSRTPRASTPPGSPNATSRSSPVSSRAAATRRSAGCAAHCIARGAPCSAVRMPFGMPDGPYSGRRAPHDDGGSAGLAPALRRRT